MRDWKSKRNEIGKPKRSPPQATWEGDLGSETDTRHSAVSGAILLVEDNPDDAFMVRRAFQQVGISNPLVEVRDGEQAIRYLTGDGDYADREQFPIPRLVLLDLDLPGVSGFDVLMRLREELELRHLPVVVLTTSTYSADLKRAYQLGANSFLTKPTDFTELVSEVKQMCSFWLGCEAVLRSDSPHGVQQSL